MASIRRIERKSGKVVWQISFWAPPTEDEKKKFEASGKWPATNSKGEIRKRVAYGTRKQAEQELAKRTTLLAEGKYLVRVGKQYRATFGDLCEKYTEAFKHQASFFAAKVYYLRHFTAYFGAETLLSHIDFHQLEKFRNYLVAKPVVYKKSEKLRTVRAVNVEITCLKHMLKKARSWGLIEHNPFHDGESLKLKGENRRTRFLKKDEIPKLLLACAPHLQPIVEAAIHLGTRAGREILDLRWGDVDFEEKRVRIRRGKTGSVDFVPMNEDCEALFRRIQPKKVAAEGHVFLYEGQPIKSVRRSFRTACQNAGIDDFRFHDLRHTCASHLIMAGCGLKEVSEHLGHKDISTTNRYLHLTDEARHKAAGLLTGLTKISPKIKKIR